MPSIAASSAVGHRRRRSARRVPPIVQIVLSIGVIVAIVSVGVLWFLHRESASSSPSASPAAQPAANGPVPMPAAPACTLSEMSLRDKLGQLLMVGVTGAADARNVLLNQHVGGIIVGGWTDLSMLGAPLAEITAAAPLPVAVGVDEEGGRVSRLAAQIGTAPSARVLAANNSVDEVYQQAKQRGEAMRNLGITVDFAPVVDVSSQGDDTVIGDRSFSDDPAKVTAYAGAYARGLRDAGLLPVLKHFPGHGRASGDSHTGSVTTPSLDELKKYDLIPYQTLTTDSPVAVMVGHMQVPGLTGSTPASLSSAAYDLLRSGGYGGPPFGGVVFTDDLSSMRAVSNSYGVADAVLKSLQAGADISLWVTSDQVPSVLDRLESAVKANELSQARVDESLGRVVAVKGRNPQC